MKEFAQTIYFWGMWSVLALCAGCRCCRGPSGADAVSAATPYYAGGERGALPPAAGDYTVLGVRDGIKSWAVKYDNTLLRGGEFFDDTAAKALAEWGVKTVISVTPNDKERAFCAQNGFILVEIPFTKKEGPSEADLRRFLDTVKNGKAPFYVHCVGGTHRGGILGLAYRVHHLDWPVERAVIEFGRLGGDLKDNHNMIDAVIRFKP
jgi:hypothetical protein